MQDMTDLIHRLNQSGKRLSKGHRKIADYIVQHYDKAVFMTASSLGESVGVSESTVVRFAGALGYEGYPQLQRALQELVRHRLTAAQRFEMAAELRQEEVLHTVLRTDMQNIRSTIEGMDERVFENVVERIVSARSIYVVGVRSASMLANFLAYYLHYVFDNVHLPTDMSVDIFEQISRIGPEDVLIGISFPRYSRRTLEAMSFARSRGAQVIGITDGPMSPLVDASTECLMASTDMASFVDSLAAPLSLINALIVAIGLRRKVELSEHFRQLEEIWQQNHIYLEREKT